MKAVVRKVLPNHIIDEVWALYRNTTNSIEIDGRVSDRHSSGQNGMFLLSKYTVDEFKNVWDSVEKLAEITVGSKLELVYCRVLKYGLNGHIVKHVDAYASKWQKENDISIIIQLSDPGKYRGGELIISKELMDLQPGDMLIYTYEHEHEVKPVKDGLRYVINLRCKRIK